MKSYLLFSLPVVLWINAAYADEEKWSYPTGLVNPEKEILNDFLGNNDSNAHEKTAYVTDSIKQNSYCFYKSEYFIYSLMMALDYNNSFAYKELVRLLNEYYDKNNITMGKFANDLKTFFENEGKSQNEFLISKSEAESFLDLTEKIERNQGDSFITNKYLLKIITEGDSLSYCNLLDTLRNNCFPNRKHKDRYNYNYKYCSGLFGTIYHIDKSQSSDGYFSLFCIIKNYYILKGKKPSNRMKLFALYFLNTALNMDNKDAVRFIKNPW